MCLNLIMNIQHRSLLNHASILRSYMHVCICHGKAKNDSILFIFTVGVRVDSESEGTLNKQDPPPVNEADLRDNKGQLKESKLLETGENSEGKKTKEEEKVVTRSPGDEPGPGVSTKYKLRGVVVHSGQASGGHYYSFVNLRYSFIVL